MPLNLGHAFQRLGVTGEALRGADKVLCGAAQFGGFVGGVVWHAAPYFFEVWAIRRGLHQRLASSSKPTPPLVPRASSSRWCGLSVFGTTGTLWRTLLTGMTASYTPASRAHDFKGGRCSDVDTDCTAWMTLRCCVQTGFERLSAADVDYTARCLRHASNFPLTHSPPPNNAPISATANITV